MYTTSTWWSIQKAVCLCNQLVKIEAQVGYKMYSHKMCINVMVYIYPCTHAVVMKRFLWLATSTLLLVLVVVVLENQCASSTSNMKNLHSRVHRESTRVACQAIGENFTASLQFVNNECRNST